MKRAKSRLLFRVFTGDWAARLQALQAARLPSSWTASRRRKLQEQHRGVVQSRLRAQSVRKVVKGGRPEKYYTLLHAVAIDCYFKILERDCVLVEDRLGFCFCWNGHLQKHSRIGEEEILSFSFFSCGQSATKVHSWPCRQSSQEHSLSEHHSHKFRCSCWERPGQETESFQYSKWVRKPDLYWIVTCSDQHSFGCRWQPAARGCRRNSQTHKKLRRPRVLKLTRSADDDLMSRLPNRIVTCEVQTKRIW